MKSLEEYLSEGKVKKSSRDPAEARSLMEQADKRLEDVSSLPLNEAHVLQPLITNFF